MTTRQERRDAQAAKIAGMTLSQRIGAVVLGGLLAFVACVATNYLLSGGPRLELAIPVALALAGVTAYQYLVAPSRQ